MLLALYDEQFVIRAYEVLLCRAPDSGGLNNYLSQIRKGVSKAQIIAEIALSDEGRSKSISVRGLDRIVSEYSRRIPSVWQWMTRSFLTGALFRTEQQLRAMENQIYRLQHAIDAQSAQLSTLLAISRGADPLGNNSSIPPRNPKTGTLPMELRSLAPPLRQTYLDLQAAIGTARSDLS